MNQFLLIDGNNLLFAARAMGPIPNIGREKLLRVIEEWAKPRPFATTLVFDGPAPRGPMADQMRSEAVTVQFSAPKTADDVIVDRMGEFADPRALRVITSDGAIAAEARRRRCETTRSEDFVEELFARNLATSAPEPIRQVDNQDSEKPGAVSPSDCREFQDTFDPNGEDPFDGAGAMKF